MAKGAKKKKWMFNQRSCLYQKKGTPLQATGIWRPKGIRVGIVSSQDLEFLQMMNFVENRTPLKDVPPDCELSSIGLVLKNLSVKIIKWDENPDKRWYRGIYSLKSKGWNYKDLALHTCEQWHDDKAVQGTFLLAFYQGRFAPDISTKKGIFGE